MFNLVSQRRYDGLYARYQQAVDARDDHEREAAGRLTTITRQAQEITRLREELAQHKQARTEPDVPGEHDVHHKALADAIHAGHDLTWAQLIDTARRTYEAAEEWKAESTANQQRANDLEAQLPEATAEEIAAWERRVKAHNKWVPPHPDSRPIDGASARPLHPATELKRALERCQKLQDRLDGRTPRGVIR